MAKQTPAELASKARWRAKNPGYGSAYYRRNAEKMKETSRLQRRKTRGIVDATGEGRAGACEICARECDSLCCDHDRATGKTRGWLCPGCNRGIGQLGDTAESVAKAFSYLCRFETLKG